MVYWCSGRSCVCGYRCGARAHDRRPHRLHSDTGRDPLVDLLQLVGKQLSVLCGDDGLDRRAQNLHSVLLQHAALKQLHS